jgi:hypothetical protein
MLLLGQMFSCTGSGLAMVFRVPSWIVPSTAPKGELLLAETVNVRVFVCPCAILGKLWGLVWMKGCNAGTTCTARLLRF